MTLEPGLLVVLGATIVLTAAVTSLLTVALVGRFMRRRFEAAARREVEAMLRRFGDTVEERVRTGVLAAVKSLPSGDLVRWTRETVTDAAGELVRGGLSSLLGDAPPGRQDPS